MLRFLDVLTHFEAISVAATLAHHQSVKRQSGDNALCCGKRPLIRELLLRSPAYLQLDISFAWIAGGTSMRSNCILWQTKLTYLKSFPSTNTLTCARRDTHAPRVAMPSQRWRLRRRPFQSHYKFNVLTFLVRPQLDRNFNRLAAEISAKAKQKGLLKPVVKFK